MATPKAGKIVTALREKIQAMTVDTAEDVYSKVNEAKISMARREELFVDHQVKVNELEQAQVDSGTKKLNELPDEDEDEDGAPPPLEREKFAPELPPGVKTVKMEEDQMMEVQEAGKLYGWNPKKKIAYVLSVLVLALGLIVSPVVMAASMTDEAVLGNDRWSVENDGDFRPNTDSSYDIGASGYEVDNIYADSVWLGGVEKTSWGSVVTPWETVGTYARLTSGGNNILAYHNGNFTIVGDLDADSLIMENDAQLDNASNNTVTLTENSDVLSIAFDGNDISITANDGSIELVSETSQADGTIDLMAGGDTDDYVEFITTGADTPSMNFSGCDGIITASGGDISFNDDNLTTTGTASFGATTVTSLLGVTSITFGDDIISRSADDVLQWASNDSSSTIQAYGYEAMDGIIKIIADESDDSGDDWQLESDAATNSLIISNDTSGSQIAKLTVNTAGNVTLGGSTLTLSNGDTLVNSIDDTLQLASEDADIIVEVYSPLATDGDATLSLKGDAGADATDRWDIINDTGASQLIIKNDDSVAGTMVTKFSIDASDGDIATTGDIAIVDDMDLILGTDNDVTVQYDEAVDNQCLFITTTTGATATTDPLFEFLVPTTPTANQQVFGVAKGSQASNTVLFTVDEDGDVAVAGTMTITGATEINGDITLQEDEVISNSSDDLVKVSSNDADMVFEIYSPKTSDGDATLELAGDADTDATDQWRIVNDTGDAALYFKNDQSVADTFVNIFTIAAADGDVTITGDVEIIDDMDLVLGTNADWKVQYDEAVDNQLLFVTSGTAAVATTDPMFEILVGTTPTADQQVFGVAKGSQGTNTALLTLDEDGDAVVTGDLTVTGEDIIIGSASVKITGDGDGAITFLGLGDGSDEDLTLNLDDVANEVTVSSSTGVTLVDLDGALDLEISGNDLTLGEAGVKLTSDADGAVTFTGLGDGFDEDLKLNFDDVTDEVTVTSSTGVALIEFGTINLATDALDVSDGNISNVGDVSLDTLTSDAGTTITFNDDVHIGADDLIEGLTIHDAGVLTFYDNSDDVTVTLAAATDGSTYLNLTGDLVTSGDIDIDGDGLTANGDLLITPGGTEVHINGGLHVGGTDAVGDNNFKVDGTLEITGVPTFTSTAVFNGGQTKHVQIPLTSVTLDGTNPPTRQVRTLTNTAVTTLAFDADGGATGDDIIYLQWRVPDGYVADSYRINISWYHDTAETSADDLVFDMEVNATASGEPFDLAGTAFTQSADEQSDGTAEDIYTTQLNPEVEDIVVDDVVLIKLWVDESASQFDASATVEVVDIDLEWESTE